MTILEARLRRRLFRPVRVQVFQQGEEAFGSDGDVVKLRRTNAGVRLWCLWSERSHCCDDCDDLETNLEVVEFWYPAVGELRIWRDAT